MGLFDYLYDRLFEPDVRKLEKNKDVKGLIKALKYQKNSYIRGRAANRFYGFTFSPTKNT